MQIVCLCFVAAKVTFLIGFILAHKNVYHGLHDYLHVKQHRPVFYVKNIVAYAVLHFAIAVYFSTVAAYLRKAGNAGFYFKAVHKAVNVVFILVMVAVHFRPWPYNRHIAYKHVYKLWHFVQACFTQKLARTGYPWVIFYGKVPLVISHLHRTELIAPKVLTVYTQADLLKKHGAFALQFNK